MYAVYNCQGGLVESAGYNTTRSGSIPTRSKIIQFNVYFNHHLHIFNNSLC